MKKGYLFLTVLLFFVGSAFAQKQKISGTVVDKNTGQPQAFSNVIVKGTTVGTSTDENGKFELEVDFEGKEEIVLQASFVGYGVQQITVAKGASSVEFAMQPMAIMGKEIVVSASRLSETIMEAPVEIQKMNSKEILSASSGDFYQSLGNLKGIDVVTASMGFKSINMRGFNTTSPFRSVQYLDGMDNQAPGLNFPVGNLLGASELDLESVEIISGAASALYGANAFQGVINMTTKDPFKYEGVDVLVKGGNQNFLNGQMRYAKAFGEKKNFAIKLTGEFLTADDWIANDTVANLYGDIETEVDLTKIIVQKQTDEELTQEERDDFLALNSYLQFYPVGYPGKIDLQAPGYMENELSNNRTESLKAGLGLYYNFNDSLKAHYMYKFGNGTAVYQGTNRYSINNMGFQQHKLQLDGKRFMLKAYTTIENAGDSYDIVFTGINISKESIADYVGAYLGQYFDTMDSLSNGFSDEARSWMADSAHKAAADTAKYYWIEAGSDKFDSLHSAIIDNPNLQKGSKFVDASSLYHLEGQYNFDVKEASVIAGAHYRLYDPNSFGTIFSDTLMNPGDTLANGQSDFNAEFVDIKVYEYGGYMQASKKFMNDKLKLMGSFRVDKSKNYDYQYSPRLSVMYQNGDHNFRISAQQAFRAPTLQNQYLLIDLGPIILEGNLNGQGNLYTLNSVDTFRNHYDSTYEVKPELLEAVNVDPIRPEQVQTIEFGYRGILGTGFYVDLSAYYSIYSNFIGNIRAYKMLNDSAEAGTEDGTNAVLTHSSSNKTIELYQYPINAATNVATYGATVGLAYYLSSKYTIKGNYTYSDIDTTGLDDDVIPGFNTPRHKFNLGLVGIRIWRDLGFTANYKWTDSFFWQSSFGDGSVPSYSTVDLQLNYSFDNYNSVVRVGVSNLLDKKRIEAYGAPSIGRFIYASVAYRM